jgi:predicted Abi (CAAX) family protease
MWKNNYWRTILLSAIGAGLVWGYAILTQPYLATATTLTTNPSLVATSTNITTDQYQTNGEWNGRLILPSTTEIAKSTLTDWVWIEIQHAPAAHRQLIGKTLALTWNPASSIATDIRQVVVDIKFTPETLASQSLGTIHPQRLNGRAQVGSLASLAGARAVDDVWVKLAGVQLDNENDVVMIDQEPTQITGKLRGLVKIMGNDPQNTAPLPTTCPGAKPCPSEYFLVQHYNTHTQQFDGRFDTIRIPQITARPAGLFPSSIRELEKSPAGSQGWYIYGDFNPDSIFMVAALQPRSLLTIEPERQIGGADDRLNYFDQEHWHQTPQRQRKLERVGFTAAPKLGDIALLIHTFGGIGGKVADIPGVWQTVTGHFAYGTATVVKDNFTHELQWDINYNQIYAHNPDGIVAGEQDWATYMGSLQRGWLATRPVADLLINYLPVTQSYDFDGIKLAPLTELQRQLHLFAARYRTGDGTGNASVNPAKSCVQDANQALYITIKRLTETVRAQPQIQNWLTAHPQAAQTLRFKELQSLGVELEQNLVPLGLVRSDWQQNATKLVGINPQASFNVSSNPLIGLMSWRTMLPRGAQDGMGKIFSHRGASMWFLNTYQVGGVNPDIFPIAPTILFGQVEIISKVVLRIWSGFSTIPTNNGWLMTMALLLVYGVIAWGGGWQTGFLRFDNQFTKSIWREALLLGQLFFLPALIEEIIFRVILLPHPIETAASMNISHWVMISLGSFILYHPLNALTFYRAGKPTFFDWRFLTLAGLLGGFCTIAYLATGSIWPAILMHWIVVVGWLKLFGGQAMLR